MKLKEKLKKKEYMRSLMPSEVSIAQINQAAVAGDSFYLTLVKN